MMQDVDRMIDEALDAEERALLSSLDEGVIERTLGMFGPRLVWVAVLMMVVQTIVFIAGAWAAWRFFEAGDVVTQLRWGLPAAVLLLMSLIIKMGVAPALHANRLMRELKRIELQLAHASKR